MGTCPNGDPNFNRVLQVMLGDVTPTKRQMLFYGVCIPVRLTLYLTVLLFHNYRFIPILVGLASLIAILNLGSSLWSNSPQPQWWSKRFQAIMSILIFLACIAVWYKKIESYYIPMLLFISLSGGFLQSLINPIC